MTTAEPGTPAIGPHLVRNVTLAMVTVATTIGFVRVFDSASFLGPLLIVVFAGHLTAAFTRFRSTGRAVTVSAPIMVVLGALVTIGVTHFSATTAGIPTPSTFETIGTSLQGALDVLRNGTAPVTPTAGLLFPVAVGLWFAAWSSDRLTFVYRAPVEAMVPSATLFVIVTALAGPDHRWSSTAAYGLAVVVHLLVERQVSTAPNLVGLPGRRAIIGGSAMAVVALTIGLGTAATIPTFDASGIVPLRDRHTVTVVSPLVDIRSRLVTQRDDVMFEVTADHPAYWRLMALDRFDGNTWSPPNSQVPTASGYLTPSGASMLGTRMQAGFTLSGLGGMYAPAPFRPVAISDPVDNRSGDTSPRLLWDADYSTLIASGERESVTGLSYTVTASVPDVDAAQIQASTAPIPTGIQTNFTQLPDDFPDELVATASAIVADANTPLAKALALQRFFRDPANGFRYSTEVPEAVEGEDTNAIVAFLDQRIGFCEQFAGTYAALARAAGLPARIAVGFTWGDPVPTSNNPTGTMDYIVTGRNAHAWPEVYFAGVGWLPFEPTPGRGNPSATRYSGFGPAQDSSSPGEPTEPGTTTPPSTAPNPVPSTTPSGPNPTSIPDQVAPGPAASRISDPPANAGGAPTRWLWGVGVAVMVMGVGPTIRVLLRRHRRREADTEARQIRLAWAEALHAWHPLDIERGVTDTDRDLGVRLAERIENLLGDDAPTDQVHLLASLAGAAAWSEGSSTPRDVIAASQAAKTLASIATSHRSVWSRMVGWFDPRWPNPDRV